MYARPSPCQEIALATPFAIVSCRLFTKSTVSACRQYAHAVFAHHTPILYEYSLPMSALKSSPWRCAAPPQPVSAFPCGPSPASATASPSLWRKTGAHSFPPQTHIPSAYMMSPVHSPFILRQGVASVKEPAAAFLRLPRKVVLLLPNKLSLSTTTTTAIP